MHPVQINIYFFVIFLFHENVKVKGLGGGVIPAHPSQKDTGTRCNSGLRTVAAPPPAGT